MIKGDTRVHSIYGSPVAHSLSPVIFNTTFEKLSLNRAYVPFEPSNKRIVVLGAGGAAQALVHRFSTENNTIKILNRTLDRARGLADKATGLGKVSYGELTKSSLENCLDDADLLVNATPIRTS